MVRDPKMRLTLGCEDFGNHNVADAGDHRSVDRRFYPSHIKHQEQYAARCETNQHREQCGVNIPFDIATQHHWRD